MQSVPYINAWKRLLAQQHDAEEAGLIAGRIQVRYAALLRQKPQAANSSRWLRTKTIGRGDAVGDFRWKRRTGSAISGSV